MKQKNKKKYYVVTVAAIGVVTAALLFRGLSKEKESPVSLTEPEAIEQSIDREYHVASGDVTYTFRTDGILLISGNGKTQDFKNLEESQIYFLKEIYKSHTGVYPDSLEQTAVFHCVLDRVTEIVVEEGVTGLGDSSCSPFYYTESVSLPVSLKEVGQFTFLGTGQMTGNALVYEGLNTEALEWEATSFTSVQELSKGSVGIMASNDKLSLRPLEEQGTVPAQEQLLYTAFMGDTVKYNLYSNGVLVISGYGSTYDFEHYSEMEEQLMEELHYVGRMELEEQWFNKVAEIVIEDSVERIGNNALALYRNALLVTGSPTELGKRSFLNCGADTKDGTVWNMNLSDTKVDEDAFLRCRNVPEHKAVSEETINKNEVQQ